MSDPAFWLSVSCVLVGLTRLAWLGGSMPTIADRRAEAESKLVPAVSVGREYTLHFVGGPTDGLILRLPEPPGNAMFGTARYAAGEPSPSGKVRMEFAGFGVRAKVGG